MPSTTIYNLPYPSESDNANIPRDFKNLAEEIENVIDKMNTYSTEEKVVGTYLGNPLYRRTIIGTTPIENGTMIFYVSNDVVHLKKYKGVIFSNNNNSEWIIGTYYNQDVYSSLECNVSEHSIYFYGSPATLNIPCEITIEYTKSTD